MIDHLNASVLPNNTLAGGTVPQVTQLFWDQDGMWEFLPPTPVWKKIKAVLGKGTQVEARAYPWRSQTHVPH
jgi:hypothetical protein